MHLGRNSSSQLRFERKPNFNKCVEGCLAAEKRREIRAEIRRSRLSFIYQPKTYRISSAVLWFLKVEKRRTARMFIYKPKHWIQLLCTKYKIVVKKNVERLAQDGWKKINSVGVCHMLHKQEVKQFDFYDFLLKIWSSKISVQFGRQTMVGRRSNRLVFFIRFKTPLSTK